MLNLQMKFIRRPENRHTGGSKAEKLKRQSTWHSSEIPTHAHSPTVLNRLTLTIHNATLLQMVRNHPTDTQHWRTWGCLLEWNESEVEVVFVSFPRCVKYSGWGGFAPWYVWEVPVCWERSVRTLIKLPPFKSSPRSSSAQNPHAQNNKHCSEEMN